MKLRDQGATGRVEGGRLAKKAAGAGLRRGWIGGLAPAASTRLRPVRRGLARRGLVRWGGALALALACIATPPAPLVAQSYAFSSVSIQGNVRIPDDTILARAAIARGQALSAGELNDAYQRLVNSGLFEAVEIVPSGSTLIIRVTEYPTISRIALEGNKRLKDAALLPLLKSQSRRVYSPDLARADAQAIAGAYQTSGRLAATVTPKIIRRSDNRVDLVFEVVEGAVTENERISFVGNRAFSDGRLRRVLATKQAGIFRRLVQRDTYIPERIPFDEQVLRDFYLSRGYIDFRVNSVVPEFSREREATFITFNVTEGQSYRVGAVSLVSEIPEAEPVLDEFRRQLKIRSGTTYNPAVVDNVIARMETLALRKGFSFVRVDPRVTRRDREGLLDVEFALVRGPRIFVERIDIEGNQTTLDRVVRSQFRTVEGDPFNPREIREAAERIRALGFFADADVQTRQGTAPDQVIVDVGVEEQPTGSLGFGASFSADDGTGFNISFAEANFLGRGQALQFVLQTARGSRAFSLDFLEPNLLGRDLGFRVTGGYQETEDYNAEYSTNIGSISTALEFPAGENSRIGVRYTLGYSKLYAVDDGVTAGTTGSSAILHRDAALGEHWYTGPGITWSYDSRITGLDPRGGLLLRFSADLLGADGGTSLLKTQVRAAVERRIMNEDVTVRLVFDGAAVSTLDGNTRLTDRYLLSSSLFRGFAYGGMGPRDLSVHNKDALGGKYYAILRAEAEFPLGLPEEYGITGGAFLDVGSLWGLDDVAGGPKGGPVSTVDDSLHLRAAAGVSIFWTSPLGPLRFNFSRALKKKDYDRTQSFDLTISTQF